MPVIITFLEAGADPNAGGESPLNDETLEEIETDEARWDLLLAASPEKMLDMVREAQADFLAGKTTAIEVADGELKPASDVVLNLRGTIK